MDLDLDPADEAFRAQVRAWLTEHVPDPPLPSVNTAAGFAAHRDWERMLAGAGLAAVSWPARYGGRDASVARWLVFEEEYHAAAAPVRVGQNGLFLLAPTLLGHGTPETYTSARLPPHTSRRRFRELCARAAVPGARKEGVTWVCGQCEWHEARSRRPTRPAAR